jgi:DNA ligase (NAD+)
MSDDAYDRLMTQLHQLETTNPDLRDPNSPTQKVGGEVVSELHSLQHAVPMKSMDNSMSLEELEAWHKRVCGTLGTEDVWFSVEPKIDGCAISVAYEGGKLVLGMTRGTGDAGDAITHNVRTVRGLPTQIIYDPTRISIPQRMEVRGEIYMTYADFARFRQDEIAAGREAPSNPRNTTAGALRQLDPKECSRRRLRFAAYGIGACVPQHFGGVTHTAYVNWLKELGIPIMPESRGELKFDEAIEVVKELAETLTQGDVPVDGIVLKVDRREQQMILGEGSKDYNWAQAYKWERIEATTTLNGITLQVGKTGAITPVAELEPVEIGTEDNKTTVSRASLSNMDEIERLGEAVEDGVQMGLALGDVVKVEKAGAIIPRIVCIDTPKASFEQVIAAQDVQEDDFLYNSLAESPEFGWCRVIDIEPWEDDKVKFTTPGWSTVFHREEGVATRTRP